MAAQDIAPVSLFPNYTQPAQDARAATETLFQSLLTTPTEPAVVHPAPAPVGANVAATPGHGSSIDSSEINGTAYDSALSDAANGTAAKPQQSSAPSSTSTPSAPNAASSPASSATTASNTSPSDTSAPANNPAQSSTTTKSTTSATSNTRPARTNQPAANSQTSAESPGDVTATTAQTPAVTTPVQAPLASDKKAATPSDGSDSTTAATTTPVTPAPAATVVVPIVAVTEVAPATPAAPSAPISGDVKVAAPSTDPLSAPVLPTDATAPQAPTPAAKAAPTAAPQTAPLPLTGLAAALPETAVATAPAASPSATTSATSPVGATDATSVADEAALFANAVQTVAVAQTPAKSVTSANSVKLAATQRGTASATAGSAVQAAPSTLFAADTATTLDALAKSELEGDAVNAGAGESTDTEALPGQNAASSPTSFATTLSQTNSANASSATQTAQLNPVRLAPVIQQVANGLYQVASSGGNTININIHPENLGHVSVALDINKDGHVTAAISASHPQTLAMLQRDAGTLDQALQDAGLKTDGQSFSFSLSDGSNGGNGASGGQGNGVSSTVLAAQEISGTETETRQDAGSGLVDIRV